MNLLKKSVADVGFSCQEVGEAFAHANDSQQREILIAMVNAVDSFPKSGGGWAMQCRAIVDGYRRSEQLSQSDRIRISVMLGTLIEHLNEPFT